MASELEITEQQWEKLTSLSISACVSFFAVKWGFLDMAAYHARNVSILEIEKMDWLRYLTGIPAEDMPTEVLAKRKADLIELVNDWLNEEPE